MRNLAILLAGLLAAYTPVADAEHEPEPEPEPTILNGVWVLQTLQNEPVTERGKMVVTLKLNPDRTITGTSACNSVGPGKLKWTRIQGVMHGTIESDGTGAGIVTVVGCGDAHAAAVADRFWRLMETAHGWSIDHHGLLVSFADGSSAHLRTAKLDGR